jgi:aspartate aminotransferase
MAGVESPGKRPSQRTLEVGDLLYGPDFPDMLPIAASPVLHPPAHVAQALADAADAKVGPQRRGIPTLRNELARRAADELGWAVDPDRHVIVTIGAMHAIAAALLAVTDPGDEIVLAVPTFFYQQPARLFGVTPTLVPRLAEDGYRPDWPKVRAAITPRTKALVVDTPNNPTGHVLTVDDIEELAAIAEEFDLAVISDEAFELLVYEPARLVRPGAQPALRDRTITLRGFTKTYALGQWRVGYAIGAEPLMQGVLRAVAWTTAGVPLGAQIAALAAMCGPQDWLAGVVASFRANRDRVCGALGQLPGVDCHIPDGCAYAWLDVHRLDPTGDAFTDHLRTRYAIPAFAGRMFGAEGFTGIPYGGSPEAIDELLARVPQAVADWSL